MRFFTTDDLVRQIIYTPDGTGLVTCAGDRHRPNQLCWWDLRSGRLDRTIPLRSARSDVAVSFACREPLFAYADEGQINFVEGSDGVVRVIPTNGTASVVALSAGGVSIAYAMCSDDDDGYEEIVVIRSDQTGTSLEFWTRTFVQAIVFDPLQNYLVTAGNEQYTVWDLKRRESRTTGNSSEMGPIVYSPDGSLLVISSQTKATVLNADASRTIRTITVPGNTPIQALAFTPDSRTLAIAAGTAVFLVEVESGIFTQSYDWNVGPIFAVAVAPDGLTAAAGAASRVVLWDLDT